MAPSAASFSGDIYTTDRVGSAGFNTSAADKGFVVTDVNGVTVDARPGSAENVDGAFDVVLANLVGPVLVQVAPHLRARLRPSGSLVAAGITTQAERDVLSAFVAEGLGIVDRDERSDWVRLVMTA